MRSLRKRLNASCCNPALPGLLTPAAPEPLPLQLPGGLVCHFVDELEDDVERNHAQLQLRPPSQAGQPARARITLRSANLGRQGVLPALLQALLPPHGASLADLHLSDCSLTAGSFGGACRALLAPLTHLMLYDCFEHTVGTDGALRDALGALLSLTPRLRRLHFVGGGSRGGPNGPMCCLRSGLPPAVTTLQQLEDLAVVFSGVPRLPEGLPLAGEGRPGGVLQTLACSTSRWQLASWCACLALLYTLTGDIRPACPAHAGLTELNLGGNALTALPPNLAAASRLERLLLADNEQLQLTQAPVDVLAGLPRLRCLSLGGTQSNRGLVEQLRRRLPSLRFMLGGAQFCYIG